MTHPYLLKRAKTSPEKDAAADHAESCGEPFYGDGPVCTRSAGHKGQHIAASGTLILWKWATKVQP